jgi:hypothetical protein
MVELLKRSWHCALAVACCYVLATISMLAFGFFQRCSLGVVCEVSHLQQCVVDEWWVEEVLV